jgi:hypothetical protein
MPILRGTLEVLVMERTNMRVVVFGYFMFLGFDVNRFTQVLVKTTTF